MSYAHEPRPSGLADPRDFLGMAPAAACPVRPGTTAAKCATPTSCPPIADLMCLRGIDGVSFEYVKKTRRDRGTGLVSVIDRIPNHQQRFRPPFITALRRFVANMAHFGMPIESILTLGSLYCRCVSGTQRLSRHSFGEAMDIVGVRWRRPGGSPSRFDETLIHNHPVDAGERIMVLRVSAALRLAFPLVLDYHYNAAHRDHFHCELAQGRRLHGVSLFKPVQEMLGIAMGRPLAITGSFNAATREALAAFASVPTASLSGAVLDSALDRLFAHIASGSAQMAAGRGPVPVPAPAPVGPPGAGAGSAPAAAPAGRMAAEIAQVRMAQARGVSGLNELTNLVFHARHPERQGRSIARGETQSAREWIDIRDRIVRPLMPARTAAPQPAATSGPLPAGAFGTINARLPGRAPFSYRFTPEDALWTARMIQGEAGGRDDDDNRAVIWAMINRYAFFTHRNYPTFHQFIRAYSTPLQPVLNSWRAAQRHAHKPEFVRTGGTYPPPAPAGLPRGQLRRHLDLQRMPWSRLSPNARGLVERVLRGGAPNPIGNASEFASTRILFAQRHGRTPSEAEWRAFTNAFKRSSNYRWIGDVPGLNQQKNAFFVRTLRVNPRDASGPLISDLPPGAVQVMPGGTAAP